MKVRIEQRIERFAGLTDADGEGFSLSAAAAAVRDELDRGGVERAHLVSH
ncbi:hypothetical protein ACFSYH_07905 [Populibacterium corticicola]|uniref:Uncharacterized protein n=1 Tax=Populibacterium corticicola TaxID=1812826 RepID=A0ABW5XI20_9MICO